MIKTSQYGPEGEILPIGQDHEGLIAALRAINRYPFAVASFVTDSRCARPTNALPDRISDSPSSSRALSSYPRNRSLLVSAITSSSSRCAVATFPVALSTRAKAIDASKRGERYPVFREQATARSLAPSCALSPNS